MNFWEFVITFHQGTHLRFANGKEGLAAIKSLKNIFRDYTQHSYSHQHPIGTRLLRASTGDYTWIIQYAKKMELLQSINGSDEVFSRLDKLDEVYQTLAEIEVALKLKVAGLKVSFIERSQQGQTPDILIEHDSTEYNIEVTTLNAPNHNKDLNDFYLTIFNTLIRCRKLIKFGGTIVKPLKKENINPFLQELQDKVEESLKKNQVIKVNKRGYVTIYIAPEHLRNAIPKDFLNGFRFVPKIARPAENRIIDKIDRKKDQFNYQDRPSILVVHCGTSCWEPEQIFKNTGSNVDPVLNTYPDLMGIVLTSHQRWWSSIEIPVKEILENKILVTLAPAIQEYESTIIWENIQSRTRFPQKIIQAFTNYQQNLNTFFRK